MSTDSYRRVIDQWCDSTGMMPWAIDADMQIDVENTTVGLLYDPESAPAALCAYIDIGLTDSPGLHKRLLELNARLGTPDRGYFALHPTSGEAIYRINIVLSDEVNGAELPVFLATAIESARARALY